MKIYLRYFDEEILVSNPDEAVDFLLHDLDVVVSDEVLDAVYDYCESKNMFPKRFKISPKAYFIVIKTTAETMEEFKANAHSSTDTAAATEKEQLQRVLSAEQPGWYDVRLTFKRVIGTPEGKFQYVDTDFECKLKAHSVMECHERVMNHLRTREDVDPRSQFPSVKGNKFHAEYIGLTPER